MARSNPSKATLSTLPLGDAPNLRAQLLDSLKTPRCPVLVVLVGNQTGVSLPLKQSLVIGRNPDNGLVLTDAGVSWNHARIEDRGDGWVVMDLGSTNGTLVNEIPVTEQVLKPHDKITFGPTTVRFDLRDAYDQAYDKALEQMLNVDDLSGLLVRRKFDTELERMVALAASEGRRLGLLVMDLDGIKKINDTHGHLFGAYTIGESGHLIGQVLAGRGIGARFGGDEFLAAVLDADLAAIVALGEEIHAAINGHAFEKDGIALHPGISIGAAAFPTEASDPVSLFQAADAAMYRAKQSGKNRVCT